jgi:hypothetical protein
LANQTCAGNAHAHAVLFDQPAALDFGRDHHWRRHVAGDARSGFGSPFRGARSIDDQQWIAGFKFATVGVLYAVLLAFVIIVVWERFTEAELDVVHEAGAAENIYRLSQGLGDANGADLRNVTAAYLRAAIADDWPAMDSGVPGASASTKQALDAIYRMLSVVNDQGHSSIVAEIFRQLDRMTESRRARLIAAEGAVPNVIWLVLLGGAVVTIAFTFFFGMESLQAQTVMTALLIFSELLIVVAIDRPFAGSVKVHPTALAQVLADFESHPEEAR